MLADVFENFYFWNMCLKIYGLDLAKLLSAPGLAWQAASRKTKKIRSSTWYWYVINGRKRY